MKNIYVLMLFSVVMLTMLIASCADDNEPEFTGPFEASNVSAQQCTSSVSTLNCFISVWNTENTPEDTSIEGFSDSNVVKLPLLFFLGDYNFHVNWGDGSEVQNITHYSDATHNYEVAGEYTIYITGKINGWRFYVDNTNYGDAVKLLDVKQWGSLSLGNTPGRQFEGAENFNPTAPDAPNLTDTTDLYSAFVGAKKFNAEIGNWDVSSVEDMSYMFGGASIFNKPLNWGNKTSNVTSMNNMFDNAKKFNQDISGWDVGKVTHLTSMFQRASAFNKPLDWGSKTSKVTSMANMFYDTITFDQDISGWNVGAVTNMQSMFYGARAFNQDISDWDVGMVTSMASMFNGASNFNNNSMPLDWGSKTAAVTSMVEMFKDAKTFNQEIGDWNVYNVTEVDRMFNGASNFNKDISGWTFHQVFSSTDFALNSGLTSDNNPFAP